MSFKSIFIDSDKTSNIYRNNLATEITNSVFINLDNWRNSPLQNVKIIKEALSNIGNQDGGIVIFSFGAKNNLLSGLIFKLIPKVKFVPTINGLGRYAPTGTKINIFLKIYLWVLASISSSVITQNSRDFDLIKHKKKYLAHGSGIPKSFLQNDWRKTISSKLRIGYVGRAEKTKGIYRFLEIAEIFPNIEFYIFSKLPTKVKSELQKTKPHNVTLAGFHTPMHIFKNIDAIIFPSTYGEGVARVILEAPPTNTFVITTAISGNLDLVNKFGINMKIVPVTASIEDYTIAVEDLLNLKNKDLLSILQANKNNCSKLSVQEIAKVYKLVRQDLIGN